MDNRQKIVSAFIFFSLLIGVAQGLTDYFKNTQTLVSITGNLGYPVISLAIHTFNQLNSIVTLFSFLILPSFCFLAIFIVGYLYGRQNLVSKMYMFVLLFTGYILISTSWDIVFAYLVLNTWYWTFITPEVQWLPIYTTSGVTGIFFNWESYLYFIFIRVILAILLCTYLLVQGKTRETRYWKHGVKGVRV